MSTNQTGGQLTLGNYELLLWHMASDVSTVDESQDGVKNEKNPQLQTVPKIEGEKIWGRSSDYPS